MCPVKDQSNSDAETIDFTEKKKRLSFVAKAVTYNCASLFWAELRALKGVHFAISVI